MAGLPLRGEACHHGCGASGIIARELNPERRAFYELAWDLGASQSDIALLEADNIDWENNVISFRRRKTGRLSQVHFDAEVEAVLKALSQSGPLFPYLQRVRAGDRSTEFKQRCVGIGITGVSLHSYRYAWAERARRCGYGEARYVHGEETRAL